VAPCSLGGSPASGTPSGEDAAAQRAEEKEGLHIGSPEMLTYLDALGYPTETANPDQIFSHPDSTTQQLGEQIRAREGSG